MSEIHSPEHDSTIPLRIDPDWLKRKETDPQATAVEAGTPADHETVEPGTSTAVEPPPAFDEESPTPVETYKEQPREAQQQIKVERPGAIKETRARERREEDRKIANAARLSAEMSAVIISENPERLFAEQELLHKEQVLREGIITDQVSIRSNKEAELAAMTDAEERLNAAKTELKSADTDEGRALAQQKIDQASADFHEAARISSEVTAYEFKLDELKLAAAYKPAEGEPETHSGVPKGEAYTREWLASLVCRSLESSMVPPTIIRKIDGRTGSLQEWRKGEDAYDTDDWQEKVDKKQLNFLAAFHYLVWAMDGHDSNFLLDENFKITAAIDHGLSFPVDDNKRHFKSDALEAIEGVDLNEETMTPLLRLKNSKKRLGVLQNAFSLAFGRKDGDKMWQNFLGRLKYLTDKKTLPTTEELRAVITKH